MERYFKRKVHQLDSGSNWEEEIKFDLGLWKEIDAYLHDHRGKVRTKYLEMGPASLSTCNSLSSRIEEKEQNSRGFDTKWFDEFGSWLIYYVEKENSRRHINIFEK